MLATAVFGTLATTPPGSGSVGQALSTFAKIDASVSPSMKAPVTTAQTRAEA